jgi:hypothetical protein
LNRVGEFVRLLRFWFEGASVELQEQAYIAPGFFLQLPLVLEELKATGEFRRVARQIDRQITKYAWYPLVDHYFVEQKKQGIVERLWRRS